ncbi:MAG: CvpA family protein [Gammaproteobacteria bacterium]|nr:CvpA family protein [Gammaproteobacteria bacterium]MDP2349013.1 CvpA family protein [Gammaproteobacteria bacterium]
MQLQWVDFFFLLLTMISCMFGLWRGFVREVLSLLAWIAALLIARVYSQQLAPSFGGWIDSEAMQQVLAFAVLFMMTLLVGALINHLVAKLIDITGLKLTDRLLGSLFGIARGVVIVMVFVYFGGSFFSTESWWIESHFIPRTMELIEMSRMFVMDIVPIPPASI